MRFKVWSNEKKVQAEPKQTWHKWLCCICLFSSPHNDLKLQSSQLVVDKVPECITAGLLKPGSTQEVTQSVLQHILRLHNHSKCLLDYSLFLKDTRSPKLLLLIQMCSHAKRWDKSHQMINETLFYPRWSNVMSLNQVKMRLSSGRGLLMRWTPESCSLNYFFNSVNTVKHIDVTYRSQSKNYFTAEMSRYKPEFCCL